MLTLYLKKSVFKGRILLCVKRYSWCNSIYIFSLATYFGSLVTQFLANLDVYLL